MEIGVPVAILLYPILRKTPSSQRPAASSDSPAEAPDGPLPAADNPQDVYKRQLLSKPAGVVTKVLNLSAFLKNFASTAFLGEAFRKMCIRDRWRP